MIGALKKYREEITAKVIEALKNGTAPWRKPWSGANTPFNAVSGRHYNGANTVVLTMRGFELDGCADPRWMTFKQASDNGWKVKKGASGTRVTFWKDIINETDPEKEAKKILMQKMFVVFHASQIEGIEEYHPAPLKEIEANEKAEKLIVSSGARIEHGCFKACYFPAQDVIKLPEKGLFHSASGYYSTALHELVVRPDRALLKVA